MLAEGTRIQILWSLIDGEMSVNDLAETIGKPGPSVSQHLAKLRMARLVRPRREGTTIYYQLENDHVRQLIIDDAVPKRGHRKMLFDTRWQHAGAASGRHQAYRQMCAIEFGETANGDIRPPISRE